MLPAALEALSLRRNQERFALQSGSTKTEGQYSLEAPRESEDELEEAEEEQEKEDDELICLVEARVREWSCGVQLDLDALVLELQVLRAGRACCFQRPCVAWS